MPSPDEDVQDRAEALLADMSAGEKDRLYNRVVEHNNEEHVTSWDGCPWCDGDTEIAEAIESYYGLTASKEGT